MKIYAHYFHESFLYSQIPFQEFSSLIQFYSLLLRSDFPFPQNFHNSPEKKNIESEMKDSKNNVVCGKIFGKFPSITMEKKNVINKKLSYKHFEDEGGKKSLLFPYKAEFHFNEGEKNESFEFRFKNILWLLRNLLNND